MDLIIIMLVKNYNYMLFLLLMIFIKELLMLWNLEKKNYTRITTIGDVCDLFLIWVFFIEDIYMLIKL